jgi:HK97 family phage portal protein
MTTYTAKPKAIRNADGSWSVQHRIANAEQAKALLSVASSNYVTSTGTGNGGWVTVVSESFAGAWQQNVELRSTRELLAFPPIYACVTLIAGDIAKQRMRLTALTKDDVWLESEVPANSPFLLPLRRPNEYQTPYQFWTAWVISRLLYGNAYVLKVRDNRGLGFGKGNVRQMHVLDPCLVKPFVSEETGEVFYQLRRDYLATLDEEAIYVPASEIIHDRVTPLWHPLIGVSPLYAAALSGTQGVNIASNSAKFFENMSRPSGILVAPGPISAEQMRMIKAAWETNYGGNNAGKTAVLGDGMKYEAISMPASTAQLTEQAQDAARWTAMAFHVPPYKLGLDGGLKFNNMAQQDMDYYKQCLQTHMESMEQSLDAGLEYPDGVRYRSEFDESGLFRMDPISRAQAHKEAIGASYESINEARRAEDMPPVTGGDVPLSQQQYWPIDVLADRPPPTEAKPAPPAAEPAPPDAAAKAVDLDAVATLLKRAGPPRQRPDLKVING